MKEEKRPQHNSRPSSALCMSSNTALYTGTKPSTQTGGTKTCCSGISHLLRPFLATPSHQGQRNSINPYSQHSSSKHTHWSPLSTNSNIPHTSHTIGPTHPINTITKHKLKVHHHHPHHSNKHKEQESMKTTLRGKRDKDREERIMLGSSQKPKNEVVYEHKYSYILSQLHREDNLHANYHHHHQHHGNQNQLNQHQHHHTQNKVNLKVHNKHALAHLFQ